MKSRFFPPTTTQSNNGGLWSFDAATSQFVQLSTVLSSISYFKSLSNGRVLFMAQSSINNYGLEPYVRPNHSLLPATCGL